MTSLCQAGRPATDAQGGRSTQHPGSRGLHQETRKITWKKLEIIIMGNQWESWGYTMIYNYCVIFWD